MPKSNSLKAIVLAAGVGKRFGSKTKILPKCLIPLGQGKENLLRRYLDSFRKCGIKNVVLVVGHLKEKIIKECAQFGADLKIKFIHNDEYQKGSVLSLYCASRELKCNVLIMDADVYFPVQALTKLIQSKKQSSFLIDPRSKSTGEEMILTAKNGKLSSISKKVDDSLEIVGEATGIVKLKKSDAELLKKILARFVREKRVEGEYEESYCDLLHKRKIDFETIGNFFWSEMDFKEDYERILLHHS